MEIVVIVDRTRCDTCSHLLANHHRDGCLMCECVLHRNLEARWKKQVARWKAAQESVNVGR